MILDEFSNLNHSKPSYDDLVMNFRRFNLVKFIINSFEVRMRPFKSHNSSKIMIYMFVYFLCAVYLVFISLFPRFA